MNTALRFPSPGQRLTADFGRQLARNINSLRITGGPGVRVTQGPNGVTISAASQGGGGSSSASGDYFPFRLSAYMDADSGKHYAVVMTNDGCVQLLPSGTGHRFATAENAEATMAVENGWRLVAGAFSCAKDAKTAAVTTTVTNLATLEDYAWDKDDPRFDVYAVIYRTADETHSFVVTDTLEQPGAVDPLGEDAFVACVYVGTFQRTYDEDTEQYSYGVSNQVLRSTLVLREEADEDVLHPFRMKVWKDGDGAEWPVVYCPAKSVQIDRTAEGEGVASATALNPAASGAGEDWLCVGGAFGTDGSPTAAKVDALSFGADGTVGVWLFVSKDATTSAYRYVVAAVENWPTAVDESSRVAKVYLGSFAKTEAKDADGNSTTVYLVASQVVNDAQIVRIEEDEEEPDPYPFKVWKYNLGADEKPNWQVAVYIPDGAITLTGCEYTLTSDGLTAATLPDGTPNASCWYNFNTIANTIASKDGKAYLCVEVYHGDAKADKEEKQYYNDKAISGTVVDVNVTGRVSYTAWFFLTADATETRHASHERYYIPIWDGTYNLVKSEVVIAVTGEKLTPTTGVDASAKESEERSSTDVVVSSDNRTDKDSAATCVGVASWFTQLTKDGKSYANVRSMGMSFYDYLPAACVGLPTSETKPFADNLVISRFLAGMGEWKLGSISFGRNLTTANYYAPGDSTSSTNIVGGEETPENSSAGGKLVAPSYHTHTLDQVKKGKTSASDWLSSIGAFDGDDGLATIDKVDQAIQEALEGIEVTEPQVTPKTDALQDVTVIGESGSKGTADNGYAYADHVHPALQHGHISDRGRLYENDLNEDFTLGDVVCDQLLCTDDNGFIYKGTPLRNQGEETTFANDTEVLRAIRDTFNATPTKDSGGSGSVTCFSLSTTRLHYPVAGEEGFAYAGEHSGRCLLEVDSDGNVKHTGHDAFDVLAAIVEKTKFDGVAPTTSLAKNATTVKLPFLCMDEDNTMTGNEEATLPFFKPMGATYDAGIADENKTVLDATEITYKNIKSIKDAFAFKDEETAADQTVGNAYLDYTHIGFDANETDLGQNDVKAIVFKGETQKAELADVAVLAPKTGDEDQSADYAPKSDAAPAEGEDDAAKIARVGTSGYAARADHVHPVCIDMGTGAKSETMTNVDSWVSAITKNEDTWKPGDKGFTESYCSRVYKASGYSYFIFRTRNVSKTGAVIYRGPEYCLFKVRN